MGSTTLNMPNGIMTICSDLANGEFDQLMGVGARENPKRDFLLVSKVLGKHVPTSPEEAVKVQDILASKLALENLQKPLFIGMAETGVGLAHGVFSRYANKNCKLGLYLESTRYQSDRNERLQFDEEHSHTSSIYLYKPIDAAKLKFFETAEELVIVDDEVTTGNTFISLYKSIRPYLSNLKRLVICTIASNMSEADKEHMGSLHNIDISWIALTNIMVRYSRSSVPETKCNSNLKNLPKISASHTLSPQKFGVFSNGAISYANTLERIKLREHTRKAIVVGTVEDMYEAQVVAGFLQSLYANKSIEFMSTTRSPAKKFGAIDNIIEMNDVAGFDGVKNYLYNFDRSKFDEVILVTTSNRSDMVRKISKVLGVSRVIRI
jgi:Phosphoribosyl transferase/TRSP domain C terminus to PRTase_2